MIDRPKKVLFSNQYIREDGSWSKLFGTQSELARYIFEKYDEYESLISLQTFLGQALKASDEKGAKPLPDTLKERILEAVESKSESFLAPFELNREVRESLLYWKADRNDYNHTAEAILLQNLESSISECKQVIFFLPSPLPSVDRTQRSIFNEIHKHFDPNMLTGEPKVKQVYFFPSTGAAQAFWMSGVFRITSVLGAYDYDAANAMLAEINRKGLIKTFVTGPEHCAPPLLAFMTNEELNDKAETESIMTLSIETPYNVNSLKYSQRDTAYILKHKIRPFLENIGTCEEYVYKREW